MTNHPNRNWRRRMQQAADQWLDGLGRVLVEMPLAQDKPDGLRRRMREAYLAGYADGRRRDDAN